MSKGKIKTTEQFIKDAKLIHGNKYDYSKVEYKKSNINVCICCPKHGDFWQLPNNHLRGYGCKKCTNEKQRIPWDVIVKRFMKIHGDKYKYEEQFFKSQNDNIRIFCKKHNHYFTQKISHHLNGHGCPICNGGVKRNNLEFIIKAKDVHGEKYDYSKVIYKTKNDSVEIVCPKHGSFWQKAHDHISGCGCPKCVLKSQENIFSFIKESFINEKWEWEFSPDWLGSQRFDIYCKRVNLAIEYNGIQHYFPVEIFGGKESFEKCIKRDNLKEQLCKDNNCTLYIIKYDNVDYDKIKEDINNILNLK